MPAIDYKEFESLTAFNDSLTDYIRQKNIKDHRSLGQSPWQRFREDQMHIRRKSEEAIEQAFLHTKEYRVDKTGIVKLKGKEIEVGYAYIGQRVTLKYTADQAAFTSMKKISFTRLNRSIKSATARSSASSIGRQKEESNESVSLFLLRINHQSVHKRPPLYL